MRGAAPVGPAADYMRAVRDFLIHGTLPHLGEPVLADTLGLPSIIKRDRPDWSRPYAATTLISAALRERGFFRITISTSRSRTVSSVISRSTEKPASL